MTKAKSKLKKLKPKKKKFVVDRKFLNDLATSIYDSKNGKFLRLCAGTLQNGPDPEDKQRSMHCGLGELYFAITGKQPHARGVDECEVIDCAVEHSELIQSKAIIEEAKSKIRSLQLNKRLERVMIDTIDYGGDYEIQSDSEEKFRKALDRIPSTNDKGSDTKTDAVYQKRAKRVADQLREAAKHLPK